MRLWFFVFSIILISWLFTELYRRFALKYAIVDKPNDRSSHTLATPRGGGLAIIGAYYLGLAAIYIKDVVTYPIFVSLLFGGSAIAFVGWLDDQKNIPAKQRFAVHIIAAIFAMIMITEVPPLPILSNTVTLEYSGYLFCVLAIAWSTNLFNFMDGIDGIAAVELITVSLGAATILYFVGNDFFASISLVLLAFSTVGFLILNFPPAKIFMGDAGSGFLGFTLGVYAIGTSSEGTISPWSWMILYGVFMVDATVTLIRRVRNGEKWYQAHRAHVYQIMSRRWKSHKKVTLSVLLINITFLFPMAVLASLYPYYGVILVLICYMPLIAISLKLGAGLIND